MFLYMWKHMGRFWEPQPSLPPSVSPRMGLKSNSKKKQSGSPHLIQTPKSGVLKNKRAKLPQSTSQVGLMVKLTRKDSQKDPFCSSNILFNSYFTAYNRELQPFPPSHQQNEKSLLLVFFFSFCKTKENSCYSLLLLYDEACLDVSLYTRNQAPVSFFLEDVNGEVP